ncbi:hypothetical protein FB451DRAFT_1412271 [Mycena latifolia]|nr:hypothetical protein FB451DRAFT_1412271 [Mycena latifolia]
MAGGSVLPTRTTTAAQNTQNAETEGEVPLAQSAKDLSPWNPDVARKSAHDPLAAITQHQLIVCTPDHAASRSSARPPARTLLPPDSPDAAAAASTRAGKETDTAMCSTAPRRTPNIGGEEAIIGATGGGAGAGLPRDTLVMFSALWYLACLQDFRGSPLENSYSVRAPVGRMKTKRFDHRCVLRAGPHGRERSGRNQVLAANSGTEFLSTVDLRKTPLLRLAMTAACVPASAGINGDALLPRCQLSLTP